MNTEAFLRSRGWRNKPLGNRTRAWRKRGWHLSRAEANLVERFCVAKFGAVPWREHITLEELTLVWEHVRSNWTGSATVNEKPSTDESVAQD